MNKQFNFGMVGLGTMGSNLVLNMRDNGFSVAGYDKDLAKAEAFEKLAATNSVQSFIQINEFVNALETPRAIILLVPAGPIVDAVIKDLQPLLQPGDIIIDCGNSHFTDTTRRIQQMKEWQLHFMGMGISGGETGARMGASIMPGGDEVAYQRVQPMLEAVSAKYEGEPCVAYMGNGAAGHYVKMVHNGIEYALMQLISETYHVLKQFGNLNNQEMHAVFDGFNKGRLQSFLIEITAAIFTQPDEGSNEMLIDKIADTAQQKGTGQWTSQDAMEIKIPVPVIDTAVSQRIISSMKAERLAFDKHFKILKPAGVAANKHELVTQVHDALYAGFILTYAQGLAQLQKASDFYTFNINLSTVASIWRGGCIIRAALLNEIASAYKQDASLKNILMAPAFLLPLQQGQFQLRQLVSAAAMQHIPVPAYSACLSYFDSISNSSLPANLIQAQRDFFGAHGYQRIDKEGNFHTNWNKIIQ